MNITFVEGHPRIEEVRNQVAIKRGPIVYCMESSDLPENAEILDVYISGNTPLKAVYKPDFLGGITAIEGDIHLRQDKFRTLQSIFFFVAIPFLFLPYFLLFYQISIGEDIAML